MEDHNWLILLKAAALVATCLFLIFRRCASARVHAAPPAVAARELPRAPGPIARPEEAATQPESGAILQTVDRQRPFAVAVLAALIGCG